MDITKIKYDGKHVEIEWEIMKGEEAETFSLQSPEQPTDKFKKSLQSLATYVCQIVDWPTDYEGQVKIRGVSLSYQGEKHIMGAVITAMKQVKAASGPFNFNTPYIPEQAGSKDLPHLNPHLRDAIYKLIDEAKKYIKGERAQVGIFEGEEK